jgi:hypothetical protein
MKPTEFIVENSIIAQEADDMHRDHEVQMARSQMYSAAQAAIEIHRLLRDISELEGLEGWVQSKLTLASQYLESVRDYLKYEAVSQEPEMMAFAEDAASYALDTMINEEFKKQDVDAAVDKFISSGGEVKKGKSSKGPRKPGMSLASKHIGGGGDKMKPSRTGRGSNPQGKAVVATESATGGASSASGVATSMGGPGHKPTSGVPKKMGNSYKPKRVAVGKGVYDK